MANHLKIVMIGAGKLATNLSIALFKSGHNIIQIYSRDIENAKILALKTNSLPFDNLKLLNHHADLYIIAVSDSAINEILTNQDFTARKVVHTAGSVPISVFGNNIKNCGVFYPIQSFSKFRQLDLKNVPICIEANNEDFKLFLNDFAREISTKIWNLDSETRKTLHLAAVFANNFVNHTYTLAEEILKTKDLPFSIISELIQETAFKAIESGPSFCQTGPAIRNDIETQKKHLDLLSSKPEIQQFYEWISKDILLKYKQI